MGIEGGGGLGCGSGGSLMGVACYLGRKLSSSVGITCSSYGRSIIWDREGHNLRLTCVLLKTLPLKFILSASVCVQLKLLILQTPSFTLKVTRTNGPEKALKNKC